MKKAVYFFCPDPALDTVATGVLKLLKERLPLTESGLQVDGMRAYTYIDERGDRFDFVSCANYFSWCYDVYLPMANAHFADYDVAGYINWHGGASAPDRVLTVHTIGNVLTGHFAPSQPTYLRNLALALERGRVEAGLSDFTTHTEATHWSGIVHGSDPALIEGFPVPIFDIEVGSEADTLRNEAAHAVLAQALLHVFDDSPRPKVVLCLGGIHFDDTYSQALIQQQVPISIGHFLPTIWLSEESYTGERGLATLRHALESVQGGVDAIVFNDNLKKPFKDCARALAQEQALPLLKHRRLRTPLDIDWTAAG